jgi:hypothetical protein
MRYADIIRRHNAAVKRVGKAALSKNTTLAENEAVNRNTRPEMVTARNNTATVTNITIPFENRIDAL